MTILFNISCCFLVKLAAASGVVYAASMITRKQEDGSFKEIKDFSSKLQPPAAGKPLARNGQSSKNFVPWLSPARESRN
jgi:hypothetical protein